MAVFPSARLPQDASPGLSVSFRDVIHSQRQYGLAIGSSFSAAHLNSKADGELFEKTGQDHYLWPGPLWPVLLRCKTSIRGCHYIGTLSPSHRKGYTIKKNVRFVATRQRCGKSSVPNKVPYVYSGCIRCAFENIHCPHHLL